MPLDQDHRVVAVAWDGSPPSQRALEFAADLTEAMHGTLRVIHVLETPYRFLTTPRVDSQGIRHWTEPTEPIERAALEEAPSIVAASVPIETEFRCGCPSDELAAASEDAALLVVGSHGYRGFKRLVLGSTSSALLRSSKIPVLVVPCPPDDEQPAADAA